jgi:hypothetical protein
MYHYNATILSNKIKQCGYDIVEYTPTFPDTLSFTYSTTSQLYKVVKFPHHALWACTSPGLGVVGSGATYSAEEIASNFASGAWREISFAEASEESVTKERELVFPFTVQQFGGQNIYEVTKGVNGRVSIRYIAEPDGTMFENCCDEATAREYITKGTWIVKSVGPQKPSEAPPEPSKPLTISVDSEQLVEATERAEALAQAVELVNIALEDFYRLIKKLDVNVEAE